jgi:2-polyprenyl-3-methyl-5-hydroxy-6-metoxy-1,4-benzoquinol methylase
VNERNKQGWEDWGRVDPLWAVLTEPEAKGGNWDPQAFFATGTDTLEDLLAAGAGLDLPARASSALDFGCGVGRLTRALAAHVESVVGVDVATSMVTAAERFNADVPNCTFRVNSHDDLSMFGDETFDVVLCHLVLQHLAGPALVATFIAEFIRVLAPGGLLLFQLPTSVPTPPRSAVRNTLRPRTRILHGLRRLGASPVWMHRRFGWTPPMSKLGMASRDVECIVAQAGGSLVRTRDLGSDITGAHNNLYVVTKKATAGGERTLTAAKAPSYADITTNESNRLKRWLQNRRLDDALVPLHDRDSTWSGRCLDVGGGDGALSRRIAERFPRATTICYEPSETIRQEAVTACEGTGVVVIGQLTELDGAFDLVTCCEVFEHLPPQETREALDTMSSLAAQGAVVVIGVPNELYGVALLKGLFRMARRYGKYDARWATVGAATLGRPRQDRPELTLDGLGFIYPHTGFDYRRLIAQLDAHGLRVTRRYGSPFRRGPAVVNSEIYLVAEARQR